MFCVYLIFSLKSVRTLTLTRKKENVFFVKILIQVDIFQR